MRWTLGLVLTAMSASAQQQATGPALSTVREAALGAELSRLVELRSTLVNSPDALKYLQQMGSKLAAQLPDAPFPYTFSLVASAPGDPVQEPLALPGGHIFIASNLVLATRDESELAGMLAHAVVHIANRDSMRIKPPFDRSQTGNIPVVFFGGRTGFGAREVSSSMISAELTRTSNEYELQADSLAVKMAAGAGYDAGGVLRFLARERPISFMQGSDNLEARIAALGTPTQASTAPGDEFLQVQEQLRNPPRN